MECVHVGQGVALRVDDYTSLWDKVRKLVEMQGMDSGTVDAQQCVVVEFLGRILWPGDSLRTFSDPQGLTGPRTTFHQIFHGLAIGK